MAYKIAITGHRPNKLGNDYALTSDLITRIRIRIRETVRQILIDNNLEQKDITFITGMALGIDTLFALIAIEYNISFIAAIPCKNQWSRWPYKSVKLYNDLLFNPLCTIHNVSTQNYTHECMQERNEWVVNECDLLIAVWDGSSGGTANCVKYAQSVGRELIIINPKTL